VGKVAGAYFIEKAYVQKELAAGTGLIIGVPFYAEGSGGLFLKLYSYI
jgi:hypothetical protein